MSSKKNKYQYTLYSHFTDSFITDLFDDVNSLKEALEDGEYDYEVEDQIENAVVCKVEFIKNYSVKSIATLVSSEGE